MDISKFKPEKTPKKIVLGQNKTKVIKNPPIKESLFKRVKAVLETKESPVYDHGAVHDEKRAYDDPYGVLNDPDASSILKDLAFRIINVRTEDVTPEDIQEFDEFMEEEGLYNGDEESLEEARQFLRKGMKKKVSDAIKASRIKEGRDWVDSHPMHHMNVVNAYLDTNDKEKEFGKNWYKDAHTLTKFLARGSGHSTHVAAGIVANHSPQNGIYQNYHDATRVLDSGRGLGGKGSGIMASQRQADVDDKIFKDKSYHEHLKGKKISAFAHLLEHGGQTDSANPRIVIDRHAFSVLSGGRASDAAYGVSKLKSKNRYTEASNHFHNAANHLKENHNIHVEPEHLQAATWAWRQRKNQEEEITNGSLDGGKTYRQSIGTEKNWKEFAGKRFGHENLPNIPGTGYIKTQADHDEAETERHIAKYNHPDEVARRDATNKHLKDIGFNDVEF